MAKTGKNNAPYDPFNAGSKAFGALDDALGALDDDKTDEKASREGEPAADPAEPVAARTPVPDKKPAPPRRKKAKKAAGGGKAEAKDGRPSLKSRGKVTNRFTTTIEEKDRYDKAALRLSAEIGMTVDFSKITRALWEVYLMHETDVVRSVPHDEEWSRPANWDAVALAELDERLTVLLNEGLSIAARRAPKRRPGGG